jgi:hypothetical protein
MVTTRGGTNGRVTVQGVADKSKGENTVNRERERERGREGGWEDGPIDLQ